MVRKEVSSIKRTALVRLTLGALLLLSNLLLLSRLTLRRPTESPAAAQPMGLSRYAVTLQTEDDTCKLSINLHMYDRCYATVSLFLEECAPGDSWHLLQHWRTSSISSSCLLTQRQQAGTAGYTYRVIFHVQVYTRGSLELVDDFSWTTAEKTMP